MPEYTCEKCLRKFPRKSGYNDHMKKKNDCAQTSAVRAVVDKVAATIKKTDESPELVLSTDESIRKTELQKFFEDIHNVLWSSAGLSPEKALEHMTFFFAYRLIENQADELSLPSECRWSHVMMNYKNNANELDIIVKKGTSSFLKNVRTKPFFKQHEIKRAEIVQQIMCLINRIPMRILSEGDTLGDIFEHMLSRGMSTMSDEGQYFTIRKICHLAFELAYKIKKSVYRLDGSLSTFADWFCGTGGFPAEFVKGVAQKSIEEGKIIDRKKCAGSIYCQDMNVSSITTTLLNMLILTGVPFSSKNIRSGNSFTDPIMFGDAAPHKDIKIDFCFMNPPYGGDKTKGKDYKFAYSKKVKDEAGKNVTRYMVNAEIQSIGIEDDNKVSAGVQLAMATLSDDGGVSCIVLPQGFFFGATKKCVELRKKIAEEYKIHYVVDIASGAFLNTGTKTSMMVFQKGVGQTETVSFIGLDETPLVEATLEELRSKHYSLNYKQYLPQSAVEIDGFEIVKLGDLVSFSGGKFTTGYSKENPGAYPFFSGKTLQPDGSCKEFCFDGDEYLVMIKDGGSGVGNYSDSVGIGKVFYVNGKSAGTSHNAALHKKSEKVVLMYLYYYLKTIRPKIMDLAKYTTGLGVIGQADLRDIDVAIPSLERQQQIVEAIDGWTNLAQNEETSLKMLEKQVMFQVKEMGRGQARVKLAEVCNFQRGKMITKKDLVEGDYPVIGGGLSPMGYHTSSNRKEYTPLVSQSGENAGHISRYTKPVWASDCFSVSSTKMNDDFLYYSLLQIQDEINFLKTGTAQPHIYPSSIDSLTIAVPPVTEQQTLQSDFDEIRHKHAKIATYKAKAHEAIKRLIPGAK